MSKVKIGIIGTGNIGTDLLMKVKKSPILECGIFAGHNPDSEGIRRAQEMGILTTFESISYIEHHPECCQIVFDATSAKVHEYNAPILKKLGKFAIDLTPAHVGPYCVPVQNIDICLHEDNVNLITCGGQATVPIACALASIHPDIKYLEVVATIASKSAGIGTRNNIDEFTQTTKDALIQFSGIKKTKAIIVLNPAEPPITMHNTVYALIEHPNLSLIAEKLKAVEENIQKYVPGYKIIMGPIYEDGKLTITLQVIGAGDFLPKYAGNLDIITSAAIEIAEYYAVNRISRNKK